MKGLMLWYCGTSFLGDNTNHCEHLLILVQNTRAVGVVLWYQFLRWVDKWLWAPPDIFPEYTNSGSGTVVPVFKVLRQMIVSFTWYFSEYYSSGSGTVVPVFEMIRQMIVSFT